MGLSRFPLAGRDAVASETTETRHRLGMGAERTTVLRVRLHHHKGAATALLVSTLCQTLFLPVTRYTSSYFILPGTTEKVCLQGVVGESTDKE